MLLFHIKQPSSTDLIGQYLITVHKPWIIDRIKNQPPSLYEYKIISGFRSVAELWLSFGSAQMSSRRRKSIHKSYAFLYRLRVPLYLIKSQCNCYADAMPADCTTAPSYRRFNVNSMKRFTQAKVKENNLRTMNNRWHSDWDWDWHVYCFW